MQINVGSIQVPVTEQIRDCLGFDALTVESRSEGVPQSMGAAPTPWKAAAPVGTLESLLDDASCQRPPASASMANEQLRGFATRSPSSSIPSHSSQNVAGNRQLPAASGLYRRYDHMTRGPINPIEL